MSCNECDAVTDTPTITYPYRIGNKELGYGTVLVIGCKEHVELAFDRLNFMAKLGRAADRAQKEFDREMEEQQVEGE